MPKLSVIIPTYNCAEYIKDAIDSVLKQTYRDYEIIVVDDGSNDNTKTILDPYINQGAIHYIYQKNMGHACARNTGIKIAKGEFIAFLDADDMWLSNKLETQIKAFESNPEIGLVHSDLNALTYKGEYTQALRRDLSDELVRRHSGNIFNAFFCREIYISCPTVIVRKECFDKVGLFDENLTRAGFEDSEMWLRILRHYKAYYIHKPLAVYRFRPDSMSKNREKMISSHKYVIEKLAGQYNLSAAVRRRATTAMLKEWGIGRAMFPKQAREIAKVIRTKLGFLYG